MGHALRASEWLPRRGGRGGESLEKYEYARTMTAGLLSVRLSVCLSVCVYVCVRFIRHYQTCLTTTSTTLGMRDIPISKKICDIARPVCIIPNLPNTEYTGINGLQHFTI